MKTRIVVLGLSLLVWLLVGCGPSEEAVRVAIEATAAAMPATATDEPVVAVETETPAATATEEATPTAEATATSEPTAVPLGEIDLGPLLVVDGDLPEHLDGDFVVYGETFRFDREELAAADNLVSQEFYNTEVDRPGGGVAVYVYEDAGEASRSYQAVVADVVGLMGAGVSFPEDVGERAKMENEGGAQLHLVFLRCHAFVEIFMDTERELDVVSYAQGLDARLGAVVCPAGE